MLLNHIHHRVIEVKLKRAQKTNNNTLVLNEKVSNPQFHRASNFHNKIRHTTGDTDTFIEFKNKLKTLPYIYPEHIVNIGGTKVFPTKGLEQWNIDPRIFAGGG